MMSPKAIVNQATGMAIILRLMSRALKEIASAPSGTDPHEIASKALIECENARQKYGLPELP
jgi:hypothetical protein